MTITIGDLVINLIFRFPQFINVVILVLFMQLMIEHNSTVAAFSRRGGWLMDIKQCPHCCANKLQSFANGPAAK